MNIHFKNKTVFISGASSGFGLLITKKMAELGATLLLVDKQSDPLQKLSKQLEDDGTKVMALTCDVSNENDVSNTFDQFMEKFGRIDIAINNAGIINSMNRIADCPFDDFKKVIEVNLSGCFLCLKQQIKHMVPKKKGVILNVASVSGLIGSPFLGAYSASKHGVIGLTKTAAAEYGRKGLRVNAICPTFANTPMLDDIAKGKDEKFKEQLYANIPMQRLAQPEEVVNVMIMLCSEYNTYMNGAEIPVDGGLTAV